MTEPRLKVVAIRCFAVRIILGALFAFAVLGASQAASKSKSSAATKPKQIIIGLDLSTSTPLVTNEAYSAKVAERIVPELRSLEPRSQVILRTFGVYDPTLQQLRIDRVISSTHPAEEVAAIIEGVVKGVPKLVQQGTLKVQPETNILAFLENAAELVDCRHYYTEVILVSDGIEDSSLAHLTSTRAALPPPKSKLFRSCKSLEILGVGVGAKSPALTNHLRDEWAAWAKAAGFRDFSGLNDW